MAAMRRALSCNRIATGSSDESRDDTLAMPVGDSAEAGLYAEPIAMRLLRRVDRRLRLARKRSRPFSGDNATPAMSMIGKMAAHTRRNLPVTDWSGYYLASARNRPRVVGKPPRTGTTLGLEEPRTTRRCA